VLDELPPREEITEFVDLSPEEAKRYLALRRACEEQFAKREKGRPPAQLRIELLAALTRLRQLACDVRLVDPTFEGGSTKIARAVERAKELAREGNRAIVFSQFTQFLDKVRVALEEAGLRVGFLSGDTPTTKRRPLIDAFQRGDFDIFCVSLLAGGTGLNLTRASYVLHLDPWWNPAAEEQATSRAHRMGQTSPVTVYRLVARGTIEEAVLGMQADKRELASAVLEGKGNARAMGAEELLDILRFDG
jgi:SNF2 family DNA or RNA helicase